LKTTVSWYDSHAKEVAVQYESLNPERLNGWLTDLLPSGKGIVLDIGAGTGRDAAWLASRGLEVVAVEPSTAMREDARRRHPDARIQWINDSLSDFRQVSRLGLSFDFILLSAVWMHIPKGDRTRAFRKLTTLLKPGGVIAMSLRQGPAEADRGMHRVSEQEIERLAREHGAFIERRLEKHDALGRKEVTWIQIAIRLPDDGSGALPLLRHIILNDDKSSTYKLALLRALCRVADGAAGYASLEGDEYVSVPLGLVGLYWIRLFKPLLAADLPQSPANRGVERLGFVKDGFRRLMQTGTEMSHLDLRVGMTFSGERANALHYALRDACKTIEEMPAHFMTYPNGGPILPVRRQGRLPRPGTVILDAAYLSSFGELRVPQHLWRALQRFHVWVEPALVAEWSRLIKIYGQTQGRRLGDSAIVKAMTWSEPGRDVRVARERALQLIEGAGLRCVWTGRALSSANLDVDHCLPWVAWPCGDLWNLLPTLRSVNQNQKRDRLPGEAILRAAQDRIEQWWEGAYLKAENPVLPEQFRIEARASLPIVGGERFELDDVFAGLTLQRLRLKHDQQVPEWLGQT